MGKRETEVGLGALLANPWVLLVLIIGAIVMLLVGMAIIIHYGLVTAIALFAISSVGILILHSAKAIDLTKQPMFGLLPFVMLVFGYFAERIKLLSIQPLWLEESPVANALQLPPLTILASVVMVLLLAVVIAKKK